MSFFRDTFPIIILIALLAANQATCTLFPENEDDAFLNPELVQDDSRILRLPEAIVPTAYKIILAPEFKTFTFDGSVDIDANVLESTNTVTLHCGRIKILSTVVLSNNVKQKIVITKHDPVAEVFHITLSEELPKGAKIQIFLSHQGQLSDQMTGFYRSSYVDSNGKIKWLAATQFQTTSARHVFPCFDEPALKATFEVMIMREKQFSCLSNMPLKSSEEHSDVYWDTFEQSIPMSTYLVAFVVSDLDYIGTDDFRVWAKSTAIDQGHYGLSIGQQSVESLSKLFQQKYQLPKMDMVAVPDFSAGAMENWGLITYRESRLLYDEKMSSASAQQSVASVIVHEVSHMWFGNMITPVWWSCLWLSEAFARYFQYFGTAKIEPSWKMEEQFVVEQHQSALAVDGIESSQPMTRNVSTQSQIGGIGDSITYNKGASIVRMMHLVFGSSIMEAALRNYLKDNKEKGVARPEDLWVAVQDQIDRSKITLPASVEKIMSTWTTQAGFPVVTVSINKRGLATICSERFLLRNLESTLTNVTWWIPITWASESDPNFDEINVKNWVKDDCEVMSIPLSPKPSGEMNYEAGPEWVVFNVQSSGFYRVNYDEASWRRIINVLTSDKFDKIHVLNRAAILDDLLNLARAGLLDYETALDGSTYLERETNYLPFKAMFTALTYLNRRFSGYDDHMQFKKYVLKLIENVYNDLGYTDRSSDDRLTVLLRAEVNKWACSFGHGGCVSTFKKMFQRWKENNLLTIKPNQRAVAYCTAVKYGNEGDWEFLWEQYYNSNHASDQLVMLEALGCSQNPKILESYLLKAISDYESSRIRKQDTTTVFASVYNSGLLGAEFIIDFVESHRRKMTEHFGGPGTISSILSSASQHFSTQELVNRFEKLIDTHRVEFDSILASLKKSLNLAKYELQWYRQNGGAIAKWMKSFNDNSDIPITTPPSGDDGSDTTDYRLPEDIIPSKYSLLVTPQFATFTFDGDVEITASVAKPTNKIVLHTKEINNTAVQVSASCCKVKIVDQIPSEKYDSLTIELDQQLPVGTTINIRIVYTGSLNDDLRGFYRSWYTDGSGVKRWLAATHLEPVGARKMFPCFDEPALKATFTLTVNIPKGYHAISNTPANTTLPETPDGRQRIIFHETPKMSTYLVALVVSEFSSVKKDNVPYAVWARPNAIDQAEYAYSLMEPLVTAYEKALGHRYQLPKLDMVALPDFPSGAMENWGLLTYKEKNLLYDANNSAITVKQSVTNVISHEISHQWFGNLVSPLWWKYVWLSEGFARYFQYHGTAKVKTDWLLESQFVVDQLHSALSTDGSSSSHPMTQDVYSPTQIKGMFDAISYAKGASVIRMLEKNVGTDVFYRALHRYLENRKYGVVTPKDLFDAFVAETTDPKLKNSIHTIMDSWTTQAGYPVVHVNIRDNALYLKQERFIIRNKKDTNFENTWHVPITWTSYKNPDYKNTVAKHWMKDGEEKIDFKKDEKDVYIFNVQQSGFYRVNYEDNHWRVIIRVLKYDFGAVHEINRASLIDDLMNLGRAGYVDYEIVLSTTQYLVNETNYVPWRAFFNGLTYLHKQMQGKEVYAAYKRYATAILENVYKYVGFEESDTDSHEIKLLRAQVQKWACELGMSDCLFHALGYFHFWTTGDIQTIPPNYRAVSYCNVAKLNEYQRWRPLWNMYQKATFVSEKALLLESMACTTDKQILLILLDLATSENSRIRKQDSLNVYSVVYESSIEGAEYVMDFVKDAYLQMVDYFNDMSKIKSILNGLAKRVTTDELYAKYSELLASISELDPTMAKSLKSYKNRANFELNWSKKYIPQIYEWMDTNYPDEEYRLPSQLSPLKYNVSLSPTFEDGNFTFTGRVQIEMKVNEKRPMSRIVLNADQLDIEKVSIYESTSDYEKNEEFVKGEEFQVSSFKLNDTTQKVAIYMKNFIEKDKLIADITFKGILNENMVGFYRSYYRDSKGEIRWLATTQFAPTHARKAFPCFDEPALKAKFKIHIERPNGYHVLSNMPLVKSTPSESTGRTWDTFNETVVMSSYLVAFTVSNLKPMLPSVQKLNIWARPEMVPHLASAELASLRMMEYLGKETGIKYALPKMDLVAIPDFDMGAMENWGLLTFREYGLFYDKRMTSTRHADYMLTIIAHELAHMWYGNLVTCDWWEYIWLNEGFAQYMQWRIADLYRPSYDFDGLFVVHDLQVAMQIDASKSAHPMNNPVLKPDEIMNNFDTIAYGKSASVIRMLRKSIEPRIYDKAMLQYLVKHQYSTATPKDLWDSFDEGISGLEKWGVTVEKMMSTWTDQAGYPVVTVERTHKIVVMSQRPFTLNGDRPKRNYWIPITMTTASKQDFLTTWTDLWLGQNSISVNLDKPEDWIIVNIQQSGYYRVNYDLQSWKNLIKALHTDKYTSINVKNRAQIIDDLLNLARGRHVSYNVTLSATTYLLREKAYLPWKAFFNGMNYIAQRYEGQEGYEELGKYILILTNTLYEKLGFMEKFEDSHSDELSRELILNWICKFDHEKCVNVSTKFISNWRQGALAVVSPNAMPAVYCTAMRHGSESDWNFLWDQYLKTSFPIHRKVMLDALGCARSKKILQTYIQYALTSNYTSVIRKQDVSTALASVFNAGEIGVDTMLDFLMEKYKWMHKYYGNWNMVKSMFSSTTPHISTQKQIDKIEKFLSSNRADLNDLEETIKSVLQTAKENLQWYKRNALFINNWVNETVSDLTSNNGVGGIVPNNVNIISVTLLSITLYLLHR